MTRLIGLITYTENLSEAQLFLGIDRKGVKAVILIGFLSVPIYHKVLNSLVTFEKNLIFCTSMIWCWVHFDDELIQ